MHLPLGPQIFANMGKSAKATKRAPKLERQGKKKQAEAVAEKPAAQVPAKKKGEWRCLVEVHLGRHIAAVMEECSVACAAVAVIAWRCLGLHERRIWVLYAARKGR